MIMHLLAFAGISLLFVAFAAAIAWILDITLDYLMKL